MSHTTTALDAPASIANQTWLVDGHAHLHSCFAPDRFLDSASENFQHQAAACGLARGSWTPVLFTSVIPPRDSWPALLERLQTTSASWRIVVHDSLWIELVREPHPSIWMLRCVQLVTHEGIEILGCGVPEEAVAQRTGFAETVEQIWRSAGLAVVAWSMGKWWFTRRAVIERELVQLAARQSAESLLCVGDSRLRPWPCRTSTVFRLARRLQLPCLPGSDPIAVPSQETVAGRFGAIVRTSQPTDPVATRLRYSLVPDPPLQSTFGRRLGWREAAAAQAACRWSAARPLSQSCVDPRQVPLQNTRAS